MALEALAWPAEPADTDEVDGTFPSEQSYNMGTLFGIAAGGTATDCYGVRWRVPDTLSTPAGGVHGVALWAVSGSVRLAYKEFTPVPGDYQDVLFDTPVAIPAGAEFVVTVYTNHYVYRSSSPPSGWHVFSPSGNIDAYVTRLAVDNSGAASAPLGSITPSLWFYVDPLVEVPDSEPEEAFTSGTAALTLSATAAAATARGTLGTGALSLSASATRTTARVSAGRAGFTLAASAARSTSRTTAGTARMVFAASALQVRGGGGPRLVTSTQVGALSSTSRPGVITSSTRG